MTACALTIKITCFDTIEACEKHVSKRFDGSAPENSIDTYYDDEATSLVALIDAFACAKDRALNAARRNESGAPHYDALAAHIHTFYAD